MAFRSCMVKHPIDGSMVFNSEWMADMGVTEAEVTKAGYRTDKSRPKSDGWDWGDRPEIYRNYWDPTDPNYCGPK